MIKKVKTTTIKQEKMLKSFDSKDINATLIDEFNDATVDTKTLDDDVISLCSRQLNFNPT